VFVLGDLASVQQDGRPVPGVAPAAKQMGQHVGRILRDRVRGKDTAARPFAYRDSGSLATIGRMAAVAQFGKLKLSGALAWWVWLVAHIYFLIGFRNRLVVMLDWAWAYLTWQRHARIIRGRDPRDDTADAPLSERRQARPHALGKPGRAYMHQDSSRRAFRRSYDRRKSLATKYAALMTGGAWRERAHTRTAPAG
jgi:hypothetical protein